MSEKSNNNDWWERQLEGINFDLNTGPKSTDKPEDFINVKFRIRKVDFRRVEEASQRHKLTREEVIIRAIILQDTFDNWLSQGTRFLMKLRDGKVFKVDFR